MSCSIEFSKEAAADIDALYYADKSLFKRVLKKIEFLKVEPLAGKPLVGNHKGEYSFRVGNYRIVYEVEISGHVIYILTIKHRTHVY